MRVALHNLGCKVNAYELDAMAELLKNAGYTIVDFSEKDADVYIINTCTVTNIADRKSRQMLHRAKKENPNAVVVAAGCYVQEAGEALLNDGAVDILVGNNRKKDIVPILDAYFEHNGNDNNLIDISKDKEYEPLSISETATHTRAFIKIQDGCNQFCSYCIIPYARGRVRSRGAEDIIREVKNLASSNCHEIVVTGIHLSSYGMDFNNEEYNAADKNNIALVEVIEELGKIEGIERVRLGSLEPRIMTEDFVKRLAGIEKLCPHFHLSMQSGCDETLKRMNRKYDTREYYEVVERLRRYFDRPAITTDVIVGFPGETEEEFALSRAFIEKVNFYEMHVFKYSRRKGTVADRLPNQVNDSVKSERSDVLIELDLKLSKEYRESFVGTEEKVLVEEVVEKDGVMMAVGYTTKYIKVYINTGNSDPFSLINTILPVKLTSAGSDCLYGEA